MFWYRQSSQYLVAPFGDTLQVNSHVTAPDEVLIWLDPQGRLYVFQAAPPVEDYSGSADREFDWKVAFTAAGLDLSRFTLAEPRWIPPITFDHRAAWVGTYDHAPSVPIRFEAASWHGRLVYFRPIGPWTQLQGRAIQDR